MALNLTNESKFLAKHSLIYGIGYFMNRIVAFLLLPVYTIFLTPHDYGVKELVGLSTDIIGILLATAISSAVYRFYFDYDDPTDRKEVISTAILAIGGMGLIVLSFLYFCTDFMAFHILDNASLGHFFMISLTSMWFQSLNNIGYSYLRAIQHSLKFVVLSLINMIIAIGLNIYTVCHLKMGVIGILISTLVSSIFITTIFIFPLLIRIKMQFSFRKFMQMLKFGLPMVPAQIGAFVVHLSDRFFLKVYCSIADAGLYSLGYRFGAIPANFISVPFNQTWQPRRFEVHKQEDSEKVFGKIFTYFLYLVVFAGLGVAALTKEVLMIIADPKFWPAYRIVPIIILATTVHTFHNHFNMGILIHKKTKYFAYIDLSNAVLIIGLNFWLIPLYGVFGAAYATLIAFIYKVCLVYFFSRRYYKIYFETMRIVKIIISAAAIYLSTIFIETGSIRLNFCFKLLVILTYPFILYMLNFYSKIELKKVINLIVSVKNGLIFFRRKAQFF